MFAIYTRKFKEAWWGKETGQSIFTECRISVWLTSHEEEEAGHILHEATVPAAAEHADDPTK